MHIEPSGLCDAPNTREGRLLGRWLARKPAGSMARCGAELLVRVDYARALSTSARHLLRPNWPKLNSLATSGVRPQVRQPRPSRDSRPSCPSLPVSHSPTAAALPPPRPSTTVAWRSPAADEDANGSSGDPIPPPHRSTASPREAGASTAVLSRRRGGWGHARCADATGSRCRLFWPVATRAAPEARPAAPSEEHDTSMA